MPNNYLKYKRDQKLLVYWLIHASNTIIKSFPSETTIPINASGDITLSTLVALSELIAKHITPIPPTIYRLFQSVIDARKQTHSIFKQIVADDPDPEVEKSNASHLHWINGLTRAFSALGGETWLAGQKDTAEPVTDEEEDEGVIFSNKFAGLKINEEGEQDEGEEGQANTEPVIRARPQKKGKKGKGKKGKKPKSKRKPVDEKLLDNVPLESYRIIEDGADLVTDYLLAVYSAFEELSDLRFCMQNVWHDVAYRELNSSVAGTLGNIAVAMIRRMESGVEIDFPGHGSYDTIMQTITRGNPDKAQGMFRVTTARVPHNKSEPAQAMWTRDIDIREQFMIHAYQDLMDFVNDFQMTRSGKPTKPMLAELRDWNPNLDLQRATKSERLKWRRSYTINWLYDLVNVFSSIVVQRRTLRGQNINLETVDWSVNGPWNIHRRLYGLNEFAGEVTTLAMQKPGTDVRRRITPHLVFQLQCIVDSLTVSRGWSPNPLEGDSLTPAAKGFRPRRDVDLFLDRENERFFRGFCQTADILIQLLERDAMLHGDDSRHELRIKLVREVQEDFVNWLGESKYMHGLTTIPPSRFSNTNTNGLWEYSPYLCGVGLQEGLEIAHSVGLQLWDHLTEPACLVHLHNMLVKKGYLAKYIGLYASLEDIFTDEFFANGKVPDSNFSESFTAYIRTKAGTGRYRADQRRMLRGATSMHEVLDPDLNRSFKTKSFTRLFREAYWDPDRIPDSEIPVPSLLSLLRVSQTKKVLDPATGKKVMLETELVKRHRDAGMSERKLHDFESMLARADSRISLEELYKCVQVPEGYTLHHQQEPKSSVNKGGLTNNFFLTLLQMDLTGDVCLGKRPMLGFNYVAATCHVMMVFGSMEERLSKRRNHLWVDAYEGHPVLTRSKRASLTMLALQEQDDECLRLMAECFEESRVGYLPLCYWDDKYDIKETGHSTAGMAF